MSTAGGMSPLQREFLASAINKLPPSGEIIIAADRDTPGDAFAEAITQIWKSTSRDDTHVKVQQPDAANANDWNDQLLTDQRSPIRVP